VPLAVICAAPHTTRRTDGAGPYRENGSELHLRAIRCRSGQIVAANAYGWTAQIAHTRNCAFDRELPLELRSVTVHPLTVGADIAGSMKTDPPPKPGCGSVGPP
jgi:hypothetical protein